MDCSRIRNLLPDYSVQALGAREHHTVQAHLAACRECQKELHALEAVVALVEEHGALQPPPGLFNAVRNRIETGDLVRERPAWWAWLYTRPARAAAMGMATAALAIGLFMPAGHDSPTASLPVHPGPGVSTGALAASIRQHAISAGEGPVADRVAWEAVAQMVTEQGAKRSSGVE